jgi:pilus assembly protein TadC
MDYMYLRYIAIIGSIMLIFFVVFLLAWNVRTEKQKKMMQTQIDLLAQIAAKAGVSIDKIAEIVAKEKIETRD